MIIIRGAGDIATGTIQRLHAAGLPLLALETAHPAAIRRQVALSEAVYEGSARVEDVEAVRVDLPGKTGGIDGAAEMSAEDVRALREQIADAQRAGKVPLLVDPEGRSIRALCPEVVVDAILAKRNLGTTIDMAPLVIGLGPGFTAGEDVHVVIETMRGHDLGRVIRAGSALPNTNTPGVIAGHGADRVMHAPAAGVLRNVRAIGDLVKQGEEIAYIEAEDGGRTPVPASIGGLIRGLIRDGYPVPERFKIADIDPRESEYKNCFTISDKARAIAGSVLEVIVAKQNGA